MKLAEILWGPEVWCKGAMQQGRRMCIMGAALRLEHLDFKGRFEMVRLHRVIAASSIAEWNDAPERTWEDICAAVDAFDRDRLLNP